MQQPEHQRAGALLVRAVLQQVVQGGEAVWRGNGVGDAIPRALLAHPRQHRAQVAVQAGVALRA